MIEKVIINDNTLTPYNYISKVFNNGDEFTFEKGINVIIGPNGTGKTTLLNLIKHYTFCNNQYYSTVSDSALDWSVYFDGDTFLNGVDVIGDYENTVFNFIHAVEMKGKHELQNITEMTLFMGNKASMGEQVVNSLGMFFRKIFSNEVDVNFPLHKLKRYINKNDINSLWSERFKQIYEHTVKNKKKFVQPQYTMLIDEPDRNLDINNLEQIYGVVKTQKEDTQAIYVIHNPVLLYRLSKLDYIHFIEMEKGYLQKVIDFVE